MAALTADRNTKRLETQELQSYPVAASTTIYAGSMVCINTSGYAVAAANTAGYALAGVARAQADNASGSAGDINVEVYRIGSFELASSGLTIASEGQPCWVSDDQTVATTPGNVFVGIIREYVSATSAYVDVEPAVEQAPLGQRSAVANTGNINTEALADTKALSVGDEEVHFLDPGGQNRDVTLPAEASSTGLSYLIVNTADAAEDLVVKDDGAATIITISQNEAGLVLCNGTVWKGLVAANT